MVILLLLLLYIPHLVIAVFNHIMLNFTSIFPRAVRRSIQHHSEALASPEQRGAYRSASASTVRRQLAASDAALAAC